MASNLPLNTAYGLSQALINVFPTPIVSTRDPLASDRAQLGTTWVNKSSNDAFVLTSVVAGASTWVGVGGGTGTFTSLTVNPGNITATAGNINATAGSMSAGTTITAGTGIVSTTGNITASAGNVSAIGGSVSAGTTVTAGTGITATTGNIVASVGNINATLGSVTAGSNIAGLMIGATGDAGSGAATVTQFTNATNTTQSTGALSIVSTTANPGNNAGFIKIYVGLTTAYVPYFTNIAP